MIKLNKGKFLMLQIWQGAVVEWFERLALETEFDSSNPGCSTVKCFFLLAFSSSSLFLSLSPHCMRSLSLKMPVVTCSSMFDLLRGRQKERNHRKILSASSVRQTRK